MFFALGTYDHIFTLNTGQLVARLTAGSFFALTTECLVAHFAVVELFAVVAECLVAPSTAEYIAAIIAILAEHHVALATDDHISALKTGRLVAYFTVEIFALTAEFRLAHIAEVKLVAAVAECLVTLGTGNHPTFIFALKTH
jgi:hypothetical protein